MPRSILKGPSFGKPTAPAPAPTPSSGTTTTTKTVPVLLEKKKILSTKKQRTNKSKSKSKSKTPSSEEQDILSSSGMMTTMMTSPTGVDGIFIKVEPSAIKNDLSNSFSWTENNGSSNNNNNNYHYAARQSFTIAPKKSAKSLKKQIKEANKRLQWLKQQSSHDKEALKVKLKQAKVDCREELRKKYDPIMQDAKNNRNDRSVMETNKLIQYLRDDNAKLRQEMEFYAKEMRTLRLANEQLEQANISAKASYKELENHVLGLEAVQLKLKDNCAIFKKHLQRMKADYKNRNTFFQSEVRTSDTYERGLAKILAAVKSTSKDTKLIETIHKQAEEGALEAIEGRDEILAKKGLTRELQSKKKSAFHSASVTDDDDSSDSDSDIEYESSSSSDE